MSKLIIFNKPFQVLCQFTDDGDRKTLADYIDIKDVYPAGRLDFDSEGLMVLTDDGRLQAKISDPRYKLPKTYWAQVEGTATDKHCTALIKGVKLKDGLARAVSCRILKEPDLWDRDPPIRVRKTVPDSWIEIVIDEGRNRQIRKMCELVGLKVNGLKRVRIGNVRLRDLPEGKWRFLSEEESF